MHVRQVSRAHPRSRGEHPEAYAKEYHPHGSSPLTRGTQGLASVEDAARRLIPAHAGNTQRIVPARGLTWAHPRSRGEH